MFSMISVLSVYILRFFNMLFIEIYEDTYVKWMQKYPTTYITITFLFHIFYDAFPVV